MSWIQNIETLATTGSVGKCPCCKSDNTDYNATKLTSDDMGYAIMWCNDCKQSYVLSRLKITPELKTNQLVPKDLIM